MEGYEAVAKYYDGEYTGFRRDIDFYLDRLREERVRGRVVEPACGTGRVSLPLAVAGYGVSGFDRSEVMLRRARRRRSLLPHEARMRVRFSRQDMTCFAYRGTFQAAILAFSAFNLLSDDGQRTACLEGIFEHLEPGGLLLADLFNPVIPGAGDQSGPRRFESTFRHAPYGHVVTKVVEEADDPSRGTTTVRYRFQERRDRDDSSVGELGVEFELARLSRREVESAMYRSGFDVEAVFGDYGARSFSERSPRMIVQARRLR